MRSLSILARQYPSPDNCTVVYGRRRMLIEQRRGAKRAGEDLDSNKRRGLVCLGGEISYCLLNDHELEVVLYAVDSASRSGCYLYLASWPRLILPTDLNKSLPAQGPEMYSSNVGNEQFGHFGEGSPLVVLVLDNGRDVTLGGSAGRDGCQPANAQFVLPTLFCRHSLPRGCRSHLSLGLDSGWVSESAQ